MTEPVKRDVPYIEMTCDELGCTTPIYVPSDTFVTCTNCKKMFCVNCGKENIDDYGNIHRHAVATLCNYCHNCIGDSDDESSDNDYEKSES